MDAWRWPPRDPLLSAAARTVATCLLFGSALLTAAGGVLVAHHAKAGWFDRSADSRIKAALAGHDGALLALADLVKPVRVAVLIALLVVACVARRRLNGALLAVLSVPAAVGLTEGLKRLVARTLDGALVYPSGHTTAAFALAAVTMILMLGPSRHVLPFAIRLAITLTVTLAACSVALAVIGLGWHYLSDTLAGAAVGTGTVAGVSLALDQAYRRASAAHDGSTSTTGPGPARPMGRSRRLPRRDHDAVAQGKRSTRTGCPPAHQHHR